MPLAERWNELEGGLDPRWREARLELTVDDDAQRDRAAALLGPASPGRTARAIRIRVCRGGDGIGPEAATRLLRRIDGEGIKGRLVLRSTDEDPQPEQAAARTSLAADWDAAVESLPGDWSDVLAEVTLTSSDHVERGALLLAPVNPIQIDDATGFRFRCAKSVGYGASPGMVRRCLARLDEAGIPGAVRVLRALSDTHHVSTQGPVWMIGGKAV